jgi:uncharacterized membrane protein
MQWLKSFRSRLLIVLVLGICFRFYNLGHKIYWGDEVFTAMRISGYTATEVVDRTYTGKVLSLTELQHYQRPNPEKDLGDTLNALEGSPEHSPLYYLLARFWVQAWQGQPSAELTSADLARSIWVIRSLSAIISLLVFPCAYWLCQELFNPSEFSPPTAGWIAVALLAVSPFHVVYAQEARGYSLWTMTILLMGAALLRAMRRQTWASWGIYALTVALGLYTFLFSGLVAIAHAIYVLTLSGWRWSKTIAAYLTASLVGLLLFAPWLWVILSNFYKLQENVAHLEQDQPALVQLWLLNLSRIFFDFNHGSSWINPLIYVTLILAAYAIYWLCLSTPKRIWLFILSLIGVMGTALIVSDLVLGGQRSGIARYPIPCYLGIQLAIAALFAHFIRSNSSTSNSAKHWRRGLVGLCLVGIVSCAISSQAELWWNKGMFKSRYNPQVAALINQSVNERNQALVVSDSSIDRVLALSYLLAPQVQFQLVMKPNVPRIPRSLSEVYLYQPSINLKNKLERRQRYRFTSFYQGWVWQAPSSIP